MRKFLKLGCGAVLGIVALVVLINVMNGSTGASNTSNAPPPTLPAPSTTDWAPYPGFTLPAYTPSPYVPAPPDSIVYKANTTGAGISMVTILKPDFGISQDTNVKGKHWTQTVSTTRDHVGINMDAQNSGSGTISCEITLNGDVLFSNSSSGQYAVVSCG